MNAPVVPPRATSIASLYARHFAFVWRMLRRFGVDHEDLEDRTHDVFLVAHRRWEEFEGRSTDSTWLYGIARRVAADHRRSRERRHRRQSALADQERVGSPTRRDASEALVFLDSFLATLGEDLREAFVLFELEGMRGQEVAEMTGVNTNTLYARRRKARLAFESMIGSDEVGPKQLKRVAGGHEPEPGREQRVASMLPFLALGIENPAELVEVTEFAPGASTSAGVTKLAALVGGLALAAVVARGFLDEGTSTDPIANASTPAKTAAPRNPVAISPPPEVQAPPATTPTGAAATAQANPSVQAPAASTPDQGRRVAGTPAGTPAGKTAAPSESDLARQAEEHARAREALRAGQAAQSLTLVDDYLQRYPSGPFAESSRLLRIESLCSLGRVTEARADAQALAGTSRDPSVQKAARAACKVVPRPARPASP